MVQTNDQYKFCHDAVLEYVLCGDTSALAANLHIHIRQLNTINSETGKTGFERDLEIINRISPRAETFSYSVGKEDGNAKKNRYASCIPPDEIRIYLSPVSGQQSDSSYINAATVDVIHIYFVHCIFGSSYRRFCRDIREAKCILQLKDL
jgi:protein tyrosine phosphatase